MSGGLTGGLTPFQSRFITTHLEVLPDNAGPMVLLLDRGALAADVGTSSIYLWLNAIHEPASSIAFITTTSFQETIATLRLLLLATAQLFETVVLWNVTITAISSPVPFYAAL